MSNVVIIQTPSIERAKELEQQATEGLKQMKLGQDNAIIACHKMIRRAPFSLGSQPQKRPQDLSAQIPPKIVPITVSKRLKPMTPTIILLKFLAASLLRVFEKKPHKMKNTPRLPAKKEEL